ncbi:sigma-70 family RNA polymerase sigma factor [Thermanaerothrix sp. 4228-RoL]|uniref:Sigma-70 family RNA polymerase sigma factor n=1 Tax=Thermanaerothrix solaris TaxID=3058434 RepID=A0ABU3NQL1_9CHLR|nr:sigma-70 family RNA polymerase sigma factor [Thermanaerothrix sp. 4228-RoL]MDT8898675.1 sigma-70 family RNA polymerase sigma factor [Thermanaerothrix sp. 4228-RoL]
MNAIGWSLPELITTWPLPRCGQGHRRGPSFLARDGVYWGERTVLLLALAGMDDFSDLISRARVLDADALATLHDALYPAIYRYIAYRLGHGPLSEDLTAEVFLRLLEALRARRVRGENLRAWCFTTAHHLVMDYLRQHYRHAVQALDGGHPDPQVHPEQALEAQQRLEAVQRAMRHLTPEQQHVLTLRFSQECSLEETAALMGKSVNAVKVLQFRALMALRRWLEREGA